MWLITGEDDQQKHVVTEADESTLSQRVEDAVWAQPTLEHLFL